MTKLQEQHQGKAVSARTLGFGVGDLKGSSLLVLPVAFCSFGVGLVAPGICPGRDLAAAFPWFIMQGEAGTNSSGFHSCFSVHTASSVL